MTGGTRGLRDSVLRRLDALRSSGIPQVCRLAATWRLVLLAHEPDRRGDCPTCSTQWHRCAVPCDVWRAAHEHLVSGGLAARDEPELLTA